MNDCYGTDIPLIIELFLFFKTFFPFLQIWADTDFKSCKFLFVHFVFKSLQWLNIWYLQNGKGETLGIFKLK